MMKKIIIAIDDDFIRESYTSAFLANNFEVLKTKSGKESLEWAETEMPDVIIADTVLSGINGFKLLESLRHDPATNKIPVIIFSKFESKIERERAMELEAVNFFVAAGITPDEVVRKVKIILGEQKSYRLSIYKNSYDAGKMITDFGYPYNLKCKECGSDLVLFLIRDLDKGENYFKASFICPNCD